MNCCACTVNGCRWPEVPELRAASRRDLQIFLRLARAEGWRVPEFERRLLQDDFSGAVQVLGEGEVFCGMVSALAHQRSGWIGNLMVPPRLRRRGYGQSLFAAAVSELERQAVETIWLTASPQGQPLYCRHGFESVGDIERWVLPAGGGARGDVNASGSDWIGLRQADRQVWGESREGLLKALAPGSRAFAHGDAVALLQSDRCLQLLGPWYAPGMCPRGNRLLLQEVMAARNPQLELVVDLLSVSPLRALLAASGFTPQGRTALMVRGDCSGVELQGMVALASLGSMG